ncbi:hypothetical protein GSI_08733 [Ganoderma sinense ZZ0214-1]|uniref:Uncharacterized protein n=1 Tax=Ganoderma sinense ZZ0214-1 TaxID=1077348 RepID=A0A2G8S4I1_9APHY|nr:hypothetical protein GSI_08733 [Ganoderma sinense ZZ0214-1]
MVRIVTTGKNRYEDCMRIGNNPETMGDGREQTVSRVVCPLVVSEHIPRVNRTAQSSQSPRVLILSKRNEGTTTRIYDRVRPAINVPTQAIVRHRVHPQLQTQVMAGVDIQTVEREEDRTGGLPERVAREEHPPAVVQLRLVRRPHVLRVERAADHAGLVAGVCDPSGLGEVEQRVRPGIEVEDEASRCDVRRRGNDAPVVAPVHVQLAQEDDHVRRRGVRALERDPSR